MSVYCSFEKNQYSFPSVDRQSRFSIHISEKNPEIHSESDLEPGNVNEAFTLCFPSTEI